MNAVIPGAPTEDVPVIPSVTLVVVPANGIVFPLGMAMVTLGATASLFATRNSSEATIAAIDERRRRIAGN